MNATRRRLEGLLGAALLGTILLSACTHAVALSAGVAAPTMPGAAADARVDTAAVSLAVAPAAAAPQVAPALVSGAIGEAEANDLSYMREEEKLARDVYAALYAQWQLPVFQNISQSEQTHTDAIKALLDRYGLVDPAEGKGAGEFTNPDLQALYDRLVQTGTQSLAGALRVGAAIEEIDILDLQERVARTDNADVRTVYENLTQGSENHLRSFVSTLERQTGETYAPQYLSADAYAEILGSSAQLGRRGR